LLASQPSFGRFALFLRPPSLQHRRPGQKVRIEQRVSLRWYELLLATAAALATVAQAMAAILSLLR
jgi:hypothetical protein